MRGSNRNNTYQSNLREDYNNNPHSHAHKIDREKTCPFLLRVFVKEGGKHMLEDFQDGKVPE